MCHVCRKFCEYAPAGTFRWLTSVIWIDIGVMGVPIFLMISGALLLNRNYDLGLLFSGRGKLKEGAKYFNKINDKAMLSTLMQDF